VTNLDAVIFDPNVDPAAANAASAAAAAPEAFFYSTPVTDVVDLFVGLDVEGREVKKVRVRELTGADEEMLARQVVSATKFLDLVLNSNVTEVDGRPATPEQLRKLLVGDRVHLALNIRRLTYGDDWNLLGVICQKCMQPFDVVVELQHDIPVTEPDPAKLPDFEVALRNGHKVRVRHVNGEDELAALDNGDVTLPQVATTFINRCVLEVDGRKGPHFKIGESLGVKDRDAINKAMADNAPGPKLGEVVLPCSNCGAAETYALNLSDIFRE
jgi:hypothetical protein